MTTNWKAVALDAHQKKHAKETAEGRSELLFPCPKKNPTAWVIQDKSETIF